MYLEKTDFSNDLAFRVFGTLKCRYAMYKTSTNKTKKNPKNKQKTWGI